MTSRLGIRLFSEVSGAPSGSLFHPAATLTHRPRPGNSGFWALDRRVLYAR
jgi:hypothetical protein